MVQFSGKRKSTLSDEDRNLLMALISSPIILTCCAIYVNFAIRGHEYVSASVFSGSTSSTSTSMSDTRSMTNMTGSSPNVRKSFKFVDDARVFSVKVNNGGAEGLWEELIKEAANLASASPIHVMEIGMHGAVKCVQAAANNLEAHCIEPSPTSRNRIISRIEKAPKETQAKIRFYQMAAAVESGKTFQFSIGGGTIDHFGRRLDIWNMKKLPDAAGQETVAVSSVSIDDIIYNKVGPIDVFGTEKNSHSRVDKIFLLKVDVQGSEPSVFSGIHKAIREHNIDFIIARFWPKAIDLMNDGKEKCVAGVEIIKQLHDAGYMLFTMGTISHPRSPEDAQEYGRNMPPHDDMMGYCKFYYEIEEKFPSDEYKMGYWTNIFAVSPSARLPKNFKTMFGKKLALKLSL